MPIKHRVPHAHDGELNIDPISGKSDVNRKPRYELTPEEEQIVKELQDKGQKKKHIDKGPKGESNENANENQRIIRDAIKSCLVLGGAAIISLTLIEDVITLGAGIADDPPTISGGCAMIFSGLTNEDSTNPNENYNLDLDIEDNDGNSD